MKINSIVSREERAYLAKEYAQIDFQAPALNRFLSEIHDVLQSHGVGVEDTVLDVGCGRGYLLRYLELNGFHALRGLDPCPELIDNRLSDAVGPGAFFEADVAEKSFDVVMTCHTLHHLPHADPIAEVEWMRRTARKLVVIVEINNTNIPMFMISLLHRRVETNAFRYNLGKVERLCRRAGLAVKHARNMKSAYISGDGVPYYLAARMGTKPYNIVLARP